jgi:diaminohydroxyphosphoribosylaminopyrimidine deaminase / 5-amino-6-(5-phosphoribosylamino)uracil reductase
MTSAAPPHDRVPEPDRRLQSDTDVWALLLALVRLRRRSGLPDRTASFRFLADGALDETVEDDPHVAARWQPSSGWSVPRDLGATARAMLDLYLPICNARRGRPFVVAHLGQSIDGYIATDSGDSRFVTGESNRRHLHRLRALCDAVIVGVGTIEADNPKLTTRLVQGDDPVRVVLDPSFRVDPNAGVLTDRSAPTLLAVDTARVPYATGRAGAAEVIGAPCNGGSLDLRTLLAALEARALDALFVEGGGATVSRFLAAGLIDTLHIAIAPLIIGAGRPGLQLPAVLKMGDCLRPSAHAYRMGEDVMWSFDIRASPPALRHAVEPALLRIS